MNLDLHDRRALVTGGSRGIGKAIARALAREGAAVVVCARNADEIAVAAAELRLETGGEVFGVAADTGDDRSVAALVAEAGRLVGGVDILVNAAATPNLGAPLEDDALEREINVKVRGYLRCARAVEGEMVSRGWGRIINVGGNAVRRTSTVVASVRNAAVVAMTKNLADELGPHGINVTVVHPSVTRTESTPRLLAEMAERAGCTPQEVEARLAGEVTIGRLVRAEEVADVVAFLASPRSVALAGDAVIASGGVRGPIHY